MRYFDELLHDANDASVGPIKELWAYTPCTEVAGSFFPNFLCFLMSTGISVLNVKLTVVTICCHMYVINVDIKTMKTCFYHHVAIESSHHIVTYLIKIAKQHMYQCNYYSNNRSNRSPLFYFFSPYILVFCMSCVWQLLNKRIYDDDDVSQATNFNRQ